MLAIVGASGKLAFATLKALLEHNLIPADKIVCTTSSDSGAAKLHDAKAKGVHVRHATYDDETSMFKALEGCDGALVISSPRIEKDYDDPPPGPHSTGREQDIYTVLRAAKRHPSLETVYYTSLAFANPSKSRVMTAHERTEAFLKDMAFENLVVIREGLYSESWPLYFGHYSVSDADDRTEIVVAGDGLISWTSISDLGLATALVVSDPVAQWSGKTFYLSQKEAHSLEDVAAMVSRAKGREVRLKIVPRREHERYYVQDRGMDEGHVRWWAATYDALREGECHVDDPTLETLLLRKGVRPAPLETAVREMLKA